MSALSQRHVLVLNKLWTAVNVITLRRALGKVFAEKAFIIDPSREFTTYTWEDWRQLRVMDGEDGLRSAWQTFKIPEVILLVDYDKLPVRKAKFSRRTIHKRDDFICQYCGKEVPSTEISIDHVMPRSRGGLTIWTNCVSSCQKCNRKKGDKTLKEAGMKLLREPKKPDFELFQIEKKFVCKSWRHFIDKLVSESYWTTELENYNNL
jgi:5-methylcytosine-specific restriction endonuclease McrA